MKHDITSLSEKAFQSLQFLCESSECEIFLKEWMSRIFDFASTEKYDSIKLPWKFDPSRTVEIRIHRNRKETDKNEVFSTLDGLKTIEVFIGESENPDLVLGENYLSKKLSDFDWDEEVEFDSIMILGAYDTLQNLYVLHPYIKNQFHKPAVCRLDHGDPYNFDREVIIEYDIKGFILRELAYQVSGIPFPIRSMKKKITFDATDLQHFLNAQLRKQNDTRKKNLSKNPNYFSFSWNYTFLNEIKPKALTRLSDASSQVADEIREIFQTLNVSISDHIHTYLADLTLQTVLNGKIQYTPIDFYLLTEEGKSPPKAQFLDFLYIGLNLYLIQENLLNSLEENVASNFIALPALLHDKSGTLNAENFWLVQFFGKISPPLAGFYGHSIFINPETSSLYCSEAVKDLFSKHFSDLFHFSKRPYEPIELKTVPDDFTPFLPEVISRLKLYFSHKKSRFGSSNHYPLEDFLWGASSEYRNIDSKLVQTAIEYDAGKSFLLSKDGNRFLLSLNSESSFFRILNSRKKG
nr:hypothetical protein [Leptospira mayottensis]